MYDDDKITATQISDNENENEKHSWKVTFSIIFEWRKRKHEMKRIKWIK